MKAEYIFPTVLIALDACAALVYAARENWRMSIYWVAAATLGPFEGDVIGTLPWLAWLGGFAVVGRVSYSGVHRFGNRSGRGETASNFDFA